MGDFISLHLSFGPHLKWCPGSDKLGKNKIQKAGELILIAQDNKVPPAPLTKHPARRPREKVFSPTGY